ncbi:uncharacterized protein TNCT_384531 [Trichonephila clavata]|uniref:Mutator-like transposase domain-containing protein n=2 Tax=Trichonephila clavata TaxID=2740835 RepID=A0A8X6HTK2_TRICU|nr:uncharacterized protein TNCT_384531 [Trichonephila clavata]
MPRAKTFGHQKRRLIRKKTSVCVASEKCDVSSSKKKIEKNIVIDRFCFDVAENKSSRRGLASSISATCKYCGSSHGSMTSNSVPAGYEVNLRFVYGMRCIGIGKSAAQTFCALMNLPPPPAKFEKDCIRQFLMRWKLLHHVQCLYSRIKDAHRASVSRKSIHLKRRLNTITVSTAVVQGTTEDTAVSDRVSITVQ